MKFNAKILDCCKTMPRLRHKLPGEDFDIRKSEVVAWLVSQPSIRQFVFNRVAQRGLIVFDRESGTWQGKDSKPPAANSAAKELEL